MSRWIERAKTLLYDGETVETSVSAGENGVVVTSHRVLAFTPDGDGANYRYVDRPNVDGVEAGSIGEEGWLEYVAKGGLGGVVAVGVGLTVDFGGLVSLGSVDTSGAGQVGVGSLMGLIDSISRLLAMLDDVLLVGGLLALTLGLAALGMYLQSRERVLAIEVAGGDDVHVHVPSATVGETAARRLREALELGPATPAGGTGSSPPANDRDEPGAITDALDAETDLRTADDPLDREAE